MVLVVTLAACGGDDGTPETCAWSTKEQAEIVVRVALLADQPEEAAEVAADCDVDVGQL